MSIEVKGLIAAVIAAALVLGITFGASAVIRNSAPPAANSQSAPSAPPSSAPAASPARITQGQQVFAGYCESCHGAQAAGGYGPSLQNLRHPDTRTMATIVNGVPGKMPAFGGKLSAAQIQATIAYLHSLQK